MSAVLEFRQVPARPGFEGSGPMFDAVVDGNPRILLIPGGDTYTLVWNGRINFEELDQKVLGELPVRISLGAPKIDLSHPTPGGSAVASLMFHSDIAEFELAEEVDHFAVTAALREIKDPDSLSFVRVDVDCQEVEVDRYLVTLLVVRISVL